MKRVAIIGQPGSGKSTLARALQTKTGLPLFHMDHIHWLPGWQERDRDEKVALALGVLAQEEWILEGNLSKINAERLQRAQMVIWLDFPFGLRAWRVLKRTIWHFGRTRPDLQEGCCEGLNPSTIRFWKYIWDTRTSGRQKIAHSLAQAPDHLKVHHLSSRQEIGRFEQTFQS